MTPHQTPEQIADKLEELAKRWPEATMLREAAALIRRPSIRPDEEMLAALKHAEQFISNGIELGFIRMPDAGTPDPAHDALPKVRAAIAKAEAYRLTPSIGTEGWRPIETAPKDGTPLRVKYKDGTEEDGVYWQAEGRCCMLGHRAGAYPAGWTSTEAGHLPVDAPAHWQPLPAPPTAQEGSNG